MKTTITNLTFKHCAFGAAVWAALLITQSAGATTGTWKTAAGGNWNTTGNWTGGIPKLAGDTANLTGAFAAGKTVTVDTAVVLGTMTIGVASGTANPYTVAQGTGGSLTFNNNGSGAVLTEATIAGTGDTISCPFTLADSLAINNSVAKTLTISGIVSDGGAGKSITVNNTAGGSVVLSAADTYSGSTTISGGTLKLSGSGSFANTPSITIASGATLDVSATTSGLTLQAGQSLTASATGANTTGTITLGASQGLTLSAAGLKFTAYGGGATPPLTAAGAGSLSVNGAPITVTTTTFLPVGTYTLIAVSGSATISGTPSLTLPIGGSGVAGTASLAFDGSGNLVLTVAAATGGPIANGDSYSVSWNHVFTTTAPGVLANDTGGAGPLIATNFTSPSHGSLTSGADGSFTYTPASQYAGTDTFTYQAWDGQTTSQVATVTMTVVDHSPVAVNDSYALASNSGLTVAAPGVLSNDTDADGDTLTAAVVGNPAHGSLTLNSDGSFSYTPNSTYFGSDSFTYQANDGLSNSATATVTLTTAAGTYTWNGGTDGSWNTAANWSGNDLPIAKSVRYDSTSTSHLTETLDRAWNIAGITVADVGAPVTIASGNSVTNTGSIDMSSAGADLTILADYVSTLAGTLTIAANRTLTVSNFQSGGNGLDSASGPGTLRLVGKAGQTVDCTNSLTFIVDGGYISSNPPVRITAESGGTVRLIVTNSGTVEVTGNGAALHVGRSGNTGTPGTNILNVEVGATIRVAPSGNTSANAVTVPNGANCYGIFNLNGGLMVLTNKYSANTTSSGETWLMIPAIGTGNGVVNLNGGTLVVPQISATNVTTGSGTLNFNGTAVVANRPNNGWITNIQNAYVQAGGAIFDTGTNAVTVAQSLQAGSPSGSLTKLGSGTLTLSKANTYTGNTIISAGTLGLSGSGSIATSPAIVVGGNATFDVSGLATPFTLGGSQTLSGTGTVTGVLTNSGTIAPGNSGIGTLTFGTAPVLDGGTLQMEISGPGSADEIMVSSGAPIYGGTLTIVNVGGALNGGEIFTLFSPAGSGSFTASNLPSLGTGLNWWLGNLTNDGSVVVNRAPTGVADHTYTRAIGTGLKIAKADLLSGVSDPDSGDSASLSGLVSMTSGQGATVTEDANYYYYTPSNDNNDTLQFIVVDTRGAAVTNTIYINVTPSIGSVQGITPPAGGSATLSFAGIQGYSYSVQRSTNLTAWVTLGMTNAPVGGFFQWLDSFSDLGSVPSQAFYRLATPAAP